MAHKIETTDVPAGDTFSEMFETMITITVGTDMMGHVRVHARNEFTDEDVAVEYLVQDDDPHLTEVAVAKVVRDVYMRSSGV